MFRYELVNSTRKFTIVAEIVPLLKKIHKRDAPFRAVLKVKTLAVLFSPYPREMKHIPRNLYLPPFWRLLVSIEMVQSIPTRALPRFTDFPSLCACSESSLSNLIGSGLNLLCLQIHSKPECRWTWPEVPQRSNACACLSRVRARVNGLHHFHRNKQVPKWRQI